MRTSLPARQPWAAICAFSLVEVVLAIAVLSVSLIVVIGLMGEGLSNNHDSSSRLQAADIASLLISTRRAAPTNSITLANFALLALGGTNAAGQDMVYATTNFTKVQTDGTAVSSASSSQIVYNLRTIVTPSGAQTNIANVDLVLWWPATLAANNSTLPVNNPSGYYELMTQIVLP